MHPHRGDNVLLKPQPPVVGPNLHTLSLKAWFNAFMVPSNAIYVARSTFYFFKSRKFLPESNSLLTQAFLYSFEMGDACLMWETYRLGKLLKDSLRNASLDLLENYQQPYRRAIWTHFYQREMELTKFTTRLALFRFLSEMKWYRPRLLSFIFW